MKEERHEEQTAFVGLGTNQGDRIRNLVSAVKKIDGHVNVEKVSSIYETEPVNVLGGDMFLNAVCSVSTNLTPRKLLGLLERLELEMGRARKGDRRPRVIDLDLLLHGQARVHEKGLTVPHPLLTERGFVLVPLCEIAPDVVHPVLRRRMSDILLDLGQVEGVRFYSRFPQEELVLR